jgi:hypothetical protein
VNPANSAQVGAAWLRLLGLPAGTSRPAAVTDWSTTGFIVVSVVGSAGGRDLSEQRKPILSLDAWGASPGSSKAPKAATVGLLGLVRRQVEAFGTSARLTIGGGYEDVLIQDAWIERPEPAEIPDPDSSLAHYVQEIGISWVGLG